MKLSLVFLGLTVIVSAQNVSDNVVLQWDQAALQAVRTTKMGPPMTARALAMVHTAMYDAWAAYDDRAIGTRLGGTMRRPPSEWTSDNKIEAISYAAHVVLMDLFPTQSAIFDAVLTQRGFDLKNHSMNLTMPAGVGHVAAEALLELRHRDGSNQHNGYADTTGYQPVNTATQITDPARWQPLAVADGKGGFTIQKFLVPHWGGVIPFALESGDQYRPAVTLPAPGSAEYQAQARELMSYSSLLTDHQKMLAEYWADGPASETPPGHWCLLAQEVSRRDGHTLDDDVKMYFALSNAGLDASIAAWDAKRAYDSVRPITAIRYLYQGKMILSWGGPNAGAMRMDGANWEPYQALTLMTPAFPEYLSGHSTFSAAAAEVLKKFSGSDLFGYSVSFKAGSSALEPGTVPASEVMLSWSTFSDAADEAGLSRRYGGIHFPAADLDGRALGRKVGNAVWMKAQWYIRGGEVN